MFTKSAAFYDAIYNFKDYAAESSLAHTLIQHYKRNTGTSLLDIACGTGHHAQYLRENYEVEGLDLDPGLLEVARQRLPELTFHQADMVNFSLSTPFDVVTCLFSAIGYAKTTGKLAQTVQNIARHLRPGGVALVEPWLFPEQFNTNHIGAVFVDQPRLKISRMNTSSIADGVSTLHFHYLVGTPEGITYFTEDHELGLFTDADYRAALAGAGLETHFDAYGLDGRGMYIGVKPA